MYKVYKRVNTNKKTQRSRSRAVKMSTSLVVKVFALPCLHAYVKYIPVYKYTCPCIYFCRFAANKYFIWDLENGANTAHIRRTVASLKSD